MKRWLKKPRAALAIAGVVAHLNCAAQVYSLPTHYTFHFLTDRALAAPDSLAHPSLQPYIPFFGKQYLNVQDSHAVFRYIKDDPAIEFIFKRHFIQLNPKNETFTLNIDPVLNLETGRDLSDSTGARLYTNTRGVLATGNIGPGFYFETMFAESQSVFPVFLKQFADSTEVVPGQGRWKTFKTRGFDYAFATGLASIQLGQNVNLSFGHGKHKQGHGYRSLLLSDNAFNYPYARITQQWFGGKVRYTNIYAVLMNLVPASVVPTPHTERLFQKKATAMQTADIRLHRRINLTLFQGVVWKPGDSRNRQHLGWEFVNPLIFTHLALHGLSDPQQNVLAGADLLIKITKKISLYGQVMADHLSDGMGFQSGIKYFDAFGLEKLTLQAEYNNTGTNAYRDPGTEPFSHYNQKLGQVLPSGDETVLMADFRIHRFYLSGRMHAQNFRHSSKTGANILHLSAGYIINPRYNLNISAGYLGRRNFYTFGSVQPDTDYLYISLKTSIYNLYYDF